MTGALALLAVLATAAPPRVAIVIDDVGLRRDAIDLFRAIPGLGGKLTWAVIPGTPFANELTGELLDSGEAVIAHLPMAPADKAQETKHLGPYLAKGDPDALRRALRERLATFPEALRRRLSGASNHQGSGPTADKGSMHAVLDTLKAERLWFLDSRTTPRTVAPAVAAKLGVRIARRDVFLDNERTVLAVSAQLDELMTIATHRGTAIGIGHPYPETAQALAAWLVKQRGKVELVRCEALLSTR